MARAALADEFVADATVLAATPSGRDVSVRFRVAELEHTPAAVETRTLADGPLAYILIVIALGAIGFILWGTWNLSTHTGLAVTIPVLGLATLGGIGVIHATRAIKGGAQ